MKNRFAAIGFPNICHFTDCVINHTLIFVNLVIFIKISVNNDIGRNQIVIAKRSS